MTLLGLFRKKVKQLGLKTEPSNALSKHLSARERLDYMIDLISNLTDDTAEDIDTLISRAQYGRFTKQKPMHEHYRCLTKIVFWSEHGLRLDAMYYIEHPESKQLLPIVRCIKDRRFNGRIVVWVFDSSWKPLIVNETTVMYVSDEPNVTGKTLKEVRARYG